VSDSSHSGTTRQALHVPFGICDLALAVLRTGSPTHFDATAKPFSTWLRTMMQAPGMVGT